MSKETPSAMDMIKEYSSQSSQGSDTEEENTTPMDVVESQSSTASDKTVEEAYSKPLNQLRTNTLKYGEKDQKPLQRTDSHMVGYESNISCNPFNNPSTNADSRTGATQLDSSAQAKESSREN